MSKKEKQPLLNPNTKRKLVRLLLRSVSFFPAGPELYYLLREIRRSKDDFEQQVNEAMEALQRSSQLVSQLEEGLKERSQKLVGLREEYERYSELAQMEEKKAEALLNQLEATLGKERSRERLFGVLLNAAVGLLFFIAGAIFSEPLRSWVSTLLGG